MLDYLSHILFFSVLIIVIIYIYIRVKFGFWALQPVFHVYDFSYIIKEPGIIDDFLPEKNKYTNFKNVETIVFNEITPLHNHRFVNLIKKNYLQNKDNIFEPNTQNIIPYFNSHNDKSFISFYNEDIYLHDIKKDTIIKDQKIIGAITSRPVYIIINNGNKEAKFTAY